MKELIISAWQPKRRLRQTFAVQVFQAIEARRRWSNFCAGLRLVLLVASFLLALIVLSWFILDLYANGFFLTLLQPGLYFSFLGWEIFISLIPWENLLGLILAFWLFELLIKQRKESSDGAKN